MSSKKSRKRRSRRRKSRRRRRPEKEWIPRTRLGEAVKNGLLTSIEEIFQNNYKVKEVEIIDNLLQNLKEEVVTIGMCQKMTDSGQQSSFKAVVCVGNENGYIGFSTAKSKEVGKGIRAAIHKAKLHIVPIKRSCGSWECNCHSPHSMPYKVKGKCGSVKVTLKPAAKGTGLVASESAKIPLKLAGIKDCYCYIKGNSKNAENTAKAVVDALKNAYKIMDSKEWMI